MMKLLKFLALHPEVILTKSHGTKTVNHWMAGISGFGSLNQWKDLLSMGKHKLWRVFLAERRKVSYKTSMHSSRMRIARLLTVSRSITCISGRGGLQRGSVSRGSASRGVGHTPRVCLRGGGQVGQTPSPCEQNNIQV